MAGENIGAGGGRIIPPSAWVRIQCTFISKPFYGEQYRMQYLYLALGRFTPPKQVKPKQSYFGCPPTAALTVFAS